MLEIAIVFGLLRVISRKVEDKGYRPGKYQLLLGALWFGGEVIGYLIGLFASRGDKGLAYLSALTVAAIGAAVSFIVVAKLPQKTVPRARRPRVREKPAQESKPPKPRRSTIKRGNESAAAIAACPKCKTRVVPRSYGTCPSCHSPISKR